MSLSHKGFRLVLCLSTALMMAISWPLWVSGGLFPKVPFLGGIRLLPVWASYARLVVTLVAMVWAAASPWPRRSLGVAIALSAWMVLEDQFRLQPWMYQFLLMGFSLAACPEPQAMGLCRLFLIALYFHSGWSKFDSSFVHDLGPAFLDAATGLFRVSTQTWPDSVRVAAILAMPACEIVVALGLCWSKSRRVAMVLAVLQHVGLIAILGPLGLGHSTIVLVWNAAIAVEVIILFAKIDNGPSNQVAVSRPASVLSAVAKGLILLAVLLPFGEPVGMWDTWPSFALYSARDEKASLCFYNGHEHFPTTVRRYIRELNLDEELEDPPRAIKDESFVDFKQWSLAERRVPVSPQGRALNGVAEALLTRYRVPSPRFIQIRRANKTTGRRDYEQFRGLDEIRRHGDTYWLNAHPAPE